LQVVVAVETRNDKAGSGNVRNLTARRVNNVVDTKSGAVLESSKGTFDLILKTLIAPAVAVALALAFASSQSSALLVGPDGNSMDDDDE
jgi:hypothetical protein